MNQKIKKILHQNCTFSDSIDKLLKLFSLKHHESQHQQVENVVKKTYIYQSQLPNEFCSKLTVAAVKEVNEQLTKATKWIEQEVP